MEDIKEACKQIAANTAERKLIYYWKFYEKIIRELEPEDLIRMAGMILVAYEKKSCF